MRPPVLAIVGPGDAASPDDLRNAAALGRLAALEGWTVISGGVASGVMEAASRAAREADGLVLGILPSAADDDATPYLSAAVVTGMGQARNTVIVLSSDAVAACGMSAGTASEAALALRLRRPLVLLDPTPASRAFFEELARPGSIHVATSAADAVVTLRTLFARRD